MSAFTDKLIDYFRAQAPNEPVLSLPERQALLERIRAMKAGTKPLGAFSPAGIVEGELLNRTAPFQIDDGSTVRFPGMDT